MKPLFSIVIPIYNKKKYLKRCIDSIVYQDFLDFEIILVDDGSNDGSELIVESYDDNRIKKHHIDNMGVSFARNYGLSKCDGEYVWFVDADDEIENESLSILNEEIELNKPDIVSFQFKVIKENAVTHYSKYKSGLYVGNELEIIIKNSLNDSWSNMLTVCRHIYKRDLIQGVKFANHDLVFAEDIVFNDIVYPLVNRLSIIPYTLYKYYKNDFGLSSYRDYICESALSAFYYIKNEYNKLGIYSEYVECLINNYLFNIIIGSGIKNKGALAIIYAYDDNPHEKVKKIINCVEFSNLIEEIPEKIKLSSFNNEIIKILKEKDEEKLWKALSKVNR